MGNKDVYDVLIIGGGPSGLYATFYAGLRKMKTKVIEYQASLGGKLHIYPEKIVWDVGGQPPIPAGKFIDQIVNQALTFAPTVVLKEQVTQVLKTAEGFEITTSTGEMHYSKSVIFAVGSGIITPQKIAVKGAERFEVTNLNYTVKSLGSFRGKTVLVSGGGHSAVDWANEIEPYAEKVYIACRKKELTAHEADIAKLATNKVECLYNTTVDSFISDQSNSRICGVSLKTADGEQIIDVDEVIVNHGYEIDNALIEQAKVKMNEDQLIEGNGFCETSVPGIFAVGDIISYEGKLNLIAGTFQDAANAINRCKQYIEPLSEERGMVSSHNELFDELNLEISKELYS